MARNRIQFQKGLSEARFATLYGSEERCREALARWRWPDGFICPKCGEREHCVLGRILRGQSIGDLAKYDARASPAGSSLTHIAAAVSSCP